MGKSFQCVIFWADAGIWVNQNPPLRDYSGICWFVSVALNSFTHTGALSIFSVSGWSSDGEAVVLGFYDLDGFRTWRCLCTVVDLCRFCERLWCVWTLKGVCFARVCQTETVSQCRGGTLTHSLLTPCKAPAELRLTCSSDIVLPHTQTFPGSSRWPLDHNTPTTWENSGVTLCCQTVPSD